LIFAFVTVIVGIITVDRTSIFNPHFLLQMWIEIGDQRQVLTILVNICYIL